MRFPLLVSIVAAVSLSPVAMSAPEDAPPKNAFVLSLNGEDQSTYSFDQYNRLTFNDGSFVLSSEDPTIYPLVFLYNEYRRVAFGQYRQDTSVDLTDAEAASTFVYDPVGCTLEVSGEKAEDFRIGVFAIDGTLVADGYGHLDLSALQAGIYIGVATDGTTKHVLKFQK